MGEPDIAKLVDSKYDIIIEKVNHTPKYTNCILNHASLLYNRLLKMTRNFLSPKILSRRMVAEDHRPYRWKPTS